MEKKTIKFFGVSSSLPVAQVKPRFDDDEAISVSHRAEEYKLEENVRVSLRFCFDYIQLSSQFNQEVPVCFYIESGTEGFVQAGRPGVDLVLIIDLSGSMQGTKLDLVKKTIEFIISKLSSNDRVALVTFNNKTNRLCPLISMTDQNKLIVLRLTQQLKAFGGTEIVEGLDMGLQILAQRRITNSVSSVLLLSDGKDNNSHSALPRTKEILMRSLHEIDSGFTIHTFGYGGDHDAELLNAMAEEKNGGFYFFEDELKIPMVFSNCLGELISVVADNIQVDIEELPCKIPVQLGKVYSEGLTKTFRMPPVISGSSKSTVFLLNFQPTGFPGSEPFDVTPVKVLVTYKVMKTGRVYADECLLRVKVYPENVEIEDIQLDADVLINFYRVKAADVMKEAAKVADAGSVSVAKDMLVQITEELKNCVVHESDVVVQIINDLQESIQKFNSKVSYEVGGKADIMSKAKNHWAKRAVNPTSYQNCVQSRLNAESELFYKNKH